jgi:HAD superfamily hydrolase (TIGR01509 family)
MPFLRDPGQTARRLVMWIESPGNIAMALADRTGLDDKIVGALGWFYRLQGNRLGTLPPPIPGVAQLLASLHGRFPMAVVSARDERSTLAFLDRSGLRSRFDVVVSALSTTHTKPFPDPVLKAAELLGVPPQDCLMIGDTTVDVRAGRLAGAQTVGVLCGFGERDELLRQGADLVLQATPDLRDLLLRS